MPIHNCKATIKEPYLCGLMRILKFMNNPITGFYKKTKQEKLAWLREHYFHEDEETLATLENYWHPNKEVQSLHDEFIENTVSNFYLPIGIAPNFNINGKLLAIPMAIEESSVVAAASNRSEEHTSELQSRGH